MDELKIQNEKLKWPWFESSTAGFENALINTQLQLGVEWMNSGEHFEGFSKHSPTGGETVETVFRLEAFSLHPTEVEC